MMVILRLTNGKLVFLALHHVQRERATHALKPVNDISEGRGFESQHRD